MFSMSKNLHNLEQKPKSVKMQNKMQTADLRVTSSTRYRYTTELKLLQYALYEFAFYLLTYLLTRLLLLLGYY